MKNALLAALFLATVALPAHAFETQQQDVHSNSSDQLTDPDDTMPAFTANPADDNRRGMGFGNPAYGLSGTIVPHAADSMGGADDFERAFSHQTDDDQIGQ